MSRLRTWLADLPGARYVPLFDTYPDLVIRTHERGSGKRLLRRSAEMERAIIELVEDGLTQPSWRGLLYVMAWGSRERLRPLYIGKAARFGKKPGKLSANLANLAADRGKFARWGDGNAYHVGDLSQAVFRWRSYKEPGQKYERWAEMLLASRDPPRLREPTYLLIVPWHDGQRGCQGAPCTLEEAEDLAIDLAIEEFEDVVLNVQGETWWAPAAAPVCPPAALSPQRPYDLITTPDALARVSIELQRERILGMDVETTLYTQELCLLQIAAPARTYLIDPLSLPPLDPLRPVLGPRGPTKVIHNAAFERRVLREAGYDLDEVFDSLQASRRLGPPRASHRLAAVCERLLGRQLVKAVQLSNWSVRPLSRAQLEYAALDAEVLIDLHRALAVRVAGGAAGGGSPSGKPP